MSLSRAISWSRLITKGPVSEWWLRALYQKGGEGLRIEETDILLQEPMAKARSLRGRRSKAVWGWYLLYEAAHTPAISSSKQKALESTKYPAFPSSHSHVRHWEPSVIRKGCIIGGNWSPTREARYTEGLSWGYNQSPAPRATTHLSTTNSEPRNHVVLPCFRGAKSVCKPAMETEMLKYPTCDNFLSI